MHLLTGFIKNKTDNTLRYINFTQAGDFCFLVEKNQLYWWVVLIFFRVKTYGW